MIVPGQLPAVLRALEELERFHRSRTVLSVGEASLARRAKQTTPLWVGDAARQSQAQLQPAQAATRSMKPLYGLDIVKSLVDVSADADR